MASNPAGSPPAQDWKVIIKDLSTDDGKQIKADAKEASWRVRAIPRMKGDPPAPPWTPDPPPDPFEAYTKLCAKMEGWTDPMKFYRLFRIDDITHIVELRDTAGVLRTFAFLHAPSLCLPLPDPLPHAKCLLLCGTWKSPATKRTGAEIVQETRESIARNLGYKDMDLIAANSDLAEKVWGGLGFKAIGPTGGGTAVLMTKSLVLPPAPAAAGQGPPGGRRRKTRKPRRKTRKTRRTRK